MSAAKLLLGAIIKAGGGPLPRKAFDVNFLTTSCIVKGMRVLRLLGAIAESSPHVGSRPGYWSVTDIGRAWQSGELVLKAMRKVKGCKAPNVLLQADSVAATRKFKPMSGWDRKLLKIQAADR